MRRGSRRSGGWEGVVLLRGRPQCHGELPLKVTEYSLPVILVYWFIQCGVIFRVHAQSGGARKLFQSHVSSNFLMFLVKHGSRNVSNRSYCYSGDKILYIVSFFDLGKLSQDKKCSWEYNSVNFQCSTQYSIFLLNFFSSSNHD
jgi:hypothetical protein